MSWPVDFVEDYAGGVGQVDEAGVGAVTEVVVGVTVAVLSAGVDAFDDVVVDAEVVDAEVVDAGVVVAVVVDLDSVQQKSCDVSDFVH